MYDWPPCRCYAAYAHLPVHIGNISRDQNVFITQRPCLETLAFVFPTLV